MGIFDECNSYKRDLMQLIQRNFAKKRAPKLQNVEGIFFLKSPYLETKVKAIPKFGYIAAILLLWMIASVTTSQN
jgi:hypothetical protein